MESSSERGSGGEDLKSDLLTSAAGELVNVHVAGGLYRTANCLPNLDRLLSSIASCTIEQDQGRSFSLSVVACQNQRYLRPTRGWRNVDLQFHLRIADPSSLEGFGEGHFWPWK